MVSNKLVVSGYSDGVLLIELTYNGVLAFDQSIRYAKHYGNHLMTWVSV